MSPTPSSPTPRSATTASRWSRWSQDAGARRGRRRGARSSTTPARRSSIRVPLTWEADALVAQRGRRRGRDLAAADRIVSGSYALPRLAAAPIEPRGAIAEYDPGGRPAHRVVLGSGPAPPPLQLAHILARPPESIRVIVPDVGGAFGSKGVIAPEVAALAAAAIALRRPLKWTEDRLGNLLACYQGRGIQGDVELALSADGQMLALRARLWADLGGYLLTTTPIPPHTAAMLMTGCYDIPAADVRIVGARTHKVPTGPYRGAGRPDAAYMLEALVDQAAHELGIDRVELRRRNLIRRFPHRTPLGFEYDSGDYERCLDVALELAGPAEAIAPGVATGSAVALYVERAGGQWEAAEIELLPGGRFMVASSACPHGQGHETTFAQIAADRLGCEPGQVQLRFGDSASVPAGVGTFGSRSVAMAGSAIVRAVEQLVAAAADVAAEALRAGTVEFHDGLFSADGRSVTWADLAAAGLSATARFESPLVFSSGAHAAQVEIDRETGRLTVSGSSPSTTPARSSTPCSPGARWSGESSRRSVSASPRRWSTTRTARTAPPRSWTTACRPRPASPKSSPARSRARHPTTLSAPRAPVRAGPSGPCRRSPTRWPTPWAGATWTPLTTPRSSGGLCTSSIDGPGLAGARYMP